VKLAEITPPGLEWFFFTTGGSDATDSVIKFARYYNTLRDKPEKMHIIGRIDSFHGSTVAATSMTGDESNWSKFGPRLPGFSHIAQPGGDVGPESLEEEILRVGPDKVAMFIAEPISTPPRVNIPSDDYWPAMREICTKYDVLMSFDEVVTGFGRTGTMFAAERWRIAPDLMQMSKGITSGYFPLGAVGLTEEIADVLAVGGELSHGFTTGGHPVGCAVALENIRIMEDEDLVARGAAAGARLRSILEDRFIGRGLFSSVRGLGSLSVIDFDPQVPTDVSDRLAGALDDQRLLVRSYGNGRTIGFAPSLAITDGEVDQAIARFGHAVSEV
jgi:adenosylmethionine-8-amino-7-oxononanoate aminotransferase